MSCIDKFMSLVMDREEDGNTSPIIQHGNVTFVYIKYNNLYLVATTMKNCNIALVFSFLHKLVQVSILINKFFSCITAFRSQGNVLLFSIGEQFS
jgi:AP-1 complex subunit mu